jgi:hypothetical protein
MNLINIKRHTRRESGPESHGSRESRQPGCCKHKVLQNSLNVKSLIKQTKKWFEMKVEKSKAGIEQKKREEGRRAFLKKVSYAAPTLVVLGTLTKARAGFGPPPSDPRFDNDG